VDVYRYKQYYMCPEQCRRNAAFRQALLYYLALLNCTSPSHYARPTVCSYTALTLHASRAKKAHAAIAVSARRDLRESPKSPIQAATCVLPHERRRGGARYADQGAEVRLHVEEVIFWLVYVMIVMVLAVVVVRCRQCEVDFLQCRWSEHD
jgi:hypothetical protein